MSKLKITFMTFTYKIQLKNGTKQKGEIDANNKKQAEGLLKAKGYKILKLKKKPKDIMPKKISYSDITALSRQLATMTAAGIPIARGFDVFLNGVKNHPLLKALVMDIKATVESGVSFSEALKNHPKYFDKLYCGLILAGEESGNLDIMLDKVALQRENLEGIRKKVKKAMSYPMIVSIVAAGVTGILLTFAVPAFTSLFQGSGKPLPAITQITVNASDFMQAYWWVIVVSIFAMITIFKILKAKFPKIAIYQDFFMLKIPIIGEVILKSSLARFASTLEITVHSGMNLSRALEVVSLATGNAKYDMACEEINDSISEGVSFSEAIKDNGQFPILVEQMIAVGEESGSLSTMLSNLNKIYAEEVDTIVGSLSSMLEPIIMVVLGGVVGFLVVSMYMPMFQMGNAIS